MKKFVVCNVTVATFNVSFTIVEAENISVARHIVATHHNSKFSHAYVIEPAYVSELKRLFGQASVG
jgi:hypothetical protein